jgi:hypothetical protein
MRFASLGRDEGDILDDADGFLVGESFVSLFVWFVNGSLADNYSFTCHKQFLKMSESIKHILNLKIVSQTALYLIYMIVTN